MQDEAERLELLDRRLDGQGEGEPLGGAAGTERVGLLPAGARVQPRPLVAEPGDERGPRQLGHGADPAQPEPGQAGADVEVGGQEAGRAIGQEARPRRRAGR